MSEATRDVFETLAKVLLHCWIFGVVLQLITMGAILIMGETVHDLYSEMFGLSSHDSNLIIVAYTALLKLCVGVFFFIPWVAIRLVLRTPTN